jgi:hypothetical protein
MKKLLGISVLVLVPVVAAVAAEAPPEWAYPAIPQGANIPPPTDKEVKLAGSQKTYTEKQIGDPFAPPDWYPNEHPPMPDIVAHGKKPNVNGCAQCHLTSGPAIRNPPTSQDFRPNTSSSSCRNSKAATAPACCPAAPTTWRVSRGT